VPPFVTPDLDDDACVDLRSERCRDRLCVCSRGIDAGSPISYQLLREGTSVCSSDGVRIGSVAHVLAVEDEDVFDGVVINELSHDLVPGASAHRFVDASDIDSIHERAVTLNLTAAACRDLPEPSANPAVMRDDPADGGTSELGSKLRRAWDRLSGNY
jgi:hypothetical protein